MNILMLTVPPPAKAGFSTNEKRPPLGIGYLIAELKRRGHRIFFSDEYLIETDILENNFILDNKIDVVGIYLNTICYENALKMFDALKKLREKKGWNGKIIVGGPHTSVGIDSIPACVDYIFVGESEISLPKILDGGSSERVIIGEKVKDLDSLPLPAWEEFVYRPYNWKHKWLIGRYPIYTFNTSRGCPFRCTFCSVNSIWGRSYRCMSAERIVNDIVFMQKYYGAQGIYFREDHFTLNKKRIIEFCELLLKRNIRISWMCESRVDDLGDMEYQQLMSRAGCKVFYIGVESGSPRILELIRKGEKVEDFIKAFDIAKNVGIKTYASFVVGLPFENAKDLQLTEKLIDRVKPDFICKNVYVGIPGSELYDYVKKNGLYEYQDNQGILYPIGYKQNIRKYYNSDYFDVYDLTFRQLAKRKIRNMANKIYSSRISDLVG